ncbi:glycine-rich domain-containing protein [Streptomyces iconiensis]|uniref:Uncharacterized protein n=1 Tax=Streptomyces iconiensis TaxID=1384038 RepID=A0ABT7A4C7_9ACTN|nr:hypothetical protein [Streptomyces iconiensis]MDJ1136202.1 hypothetical protein [Streptomyces iconiensis]
MTVVVERTAIPVDQEIRKCLAADVRKTHPGMPVEFAERAIDQMAAFLIAGARTDAPLSPSPLVDVFWHAFILRTQQYAEFCEQVAGRFIHHNPQPPSAGEHGKAAAERQRTLTAITAAGFEVDPDLWPQLGAADCSQCHAGCSDSPAK